MNDQESRASPSPAGESNGPRQERVSFITRRDVGLVAVAVISVLSVVTYLHSVLEDIREDIGDVRTAVHANAQNLAIVQTEIKGLRRDIERVDGQADPGPIKRPAGHSRSIRGQYSTPPI